jgi:hypothetical protein
VRRNPRLALLLEDFRSERRGLRNRLPVQWAKIFQFFFERLTLLSKVYRWARRIARRFWALFSRQNSSKTFRCACEGLPSAPGCTPQGSYRALSAKPGGHFPVSNLGGPWGVN